MTKQRVYELAKQYGKKGPEMAEILRGLGFAVKGHMSVLDEADQMMVIARLEAQGLQATGGSGSDADDSDSAVDTLPKKLTEKKALPPASSAPKKLPPRKLPPRAAHSGGMTTTTGAISDSPAEPMELEQVEIAAEPPALEPQPRQTEPAAARAAIAEADAEVEAPAEIDDEPFAELPLDVRAVDEPEAPAESQDRPAEPAVDDAGAPELSDEVAAIAEIEAVEAAPGAEIDAPEREVKKLIKPQAKAKVVGKMQLPESTIRDANRRSAPRDPGSVDKDLRMKALSHTQSRSATRTGAGQRRGTAQRTGPGARGRSRDQGRGQRRRAGSGLSQPLDPNKIVQIEPPITVKRLSEALGVKVNELLATLMVKLKIPGKTINSFLDTEQAEEIALELDRNIEVVERKEAEEELLETLGTASFDIESEQRAPVLTFMGHVDHGKTTLLDALRKSDVVRGEAGGITQHIGAYKITTESGDQFVVLDTPGHAAFTSMRARGASLTDIVVLVVAADDGVMPQTEEAISHAQAAKVPIVVAINKCDTPGANPMQVKQQLAVKGLQAEDWGGNVQMVEVSALTGQGLDELVEQIMVQAEILELGAKHEAPGSGIVIESRQSAEQGIMVNVLVTDGTLRLRDMVICGESYSRVRGMIDDHGNHIKEAGPSTPLSIIGLAKLPSPGDKFFVVEDAKKAREVVDERQRRSRAEDLADRSRVTVDNIAAKLRDQAIDEAKVILKADVMGSLEPIRSGLTAIGTEEVRVNVIRAGLGAVTENDVNLAEASDAIIIAFNTVPEPAARVAAERAGVEIRQYDIIYRLLDEMKLALEGMLKPEEIEEIEGHAEIKAIFRSSKFGNIAGCLITDGLANRNHQVRLSRDGRVVHRGKLGSLRRISDDVREVKAGYECGLTITNFNDIKVGDELEFFSVKLVARKLE